MKDITKYYEPFPSTCPKDLPRHFYDSLKLYLEQGCQPGAFLTAVLSNNLERAVAYADPEAMASLKRIVQFVYNDLPGPCWGNPDKVGAWVRGEYKNWEAA
jgi:hypothetical protein